MKIPKQRVAGWKNRSQNKIRVVCAIQARMLEGIAIHQDEADFYDHVIRSYRKHDPAHELARWQTLNTAGGIK